MKRIIHLLATISCTLVFQNCQHQEIKKAETPAELISKVSVAKEEKLLRGLDLLQRSTQKSGRISQSLVINLRLDSVIKRINPSLGSTNYSFLIEDKRPLSLTNLVITENNGAYLCFFAEYIPNDPKKGWDIANFEGKVRFTSIDGKHELTTLSKPRKASNGRVETIECTTQTWTIYVVTPYAITSYAEVETTCRENGSGSGGGFSWGLDGGNNTGSTGNGSSNEIDPGVIGVNDSGNGVNNEETYVVDGEDNGSNEIPNVSEYLKCFNSSIGGEVTIYVDQPISDSSAPFFLTDVGHSWIGITQKTNGLSVTRLLGFYPKTSANPFDPSDDGKFKDDSPRDFDVSITFDFTPNQMSDLLAFIRGPIQDYHLNENNCTNFVVDAFSKSSISLPETIGYWPNNGQGLNPGNFGQDMRNYQGTFKSRNTSGGKPSGVSGNCN
jgi:hypothetical protein